MDSVNVNKTDLLRAAMVVTIVGCSAGPQSDASAQTPSLVTYDVGVSPRAIAVEDLNGDGWGHPAVRDAMDGRW